MAEHVILVDERDMEIGIMEKLAAHQAGALHRAVSVFVFSQYGEHLLQKRAAQKYHCGGMWSNACCSHPRPGESVPDAAHRRLREEMGFDCELEEVDPLVYRVAFDNGLVEHEYDHLFVGTYDGEPTLNPDEVEDWKWIGPAALLCELRENPGQYTHWFKLALDGALRKLSKGLPPLPVEPSPGLFQRERNC